VCGTLGFTQAVPAEKLLVVSDELPGDTSHGRRVLRFGPDGLLYFAIGVPCNVCKLGRSGKFQFGAIYRMNVTTGEPALVATGWGVREG
jgi:glucose/arabinose dehydrogenase